jgi:hypothetical protein
LLSRPRQCSGSYPGRSYSENGGSDVACRNVIALGSWMLTATGDCAH